MLLGSRFLHRFSTHSKPLESACISEIPIGFCLSSHPRTRSARPDCAPESLLHRILEYYIGGVAIAISDNRNLFYRSVGSGNLGQETGNSRSKSDPVEFHPRSTYHYYNRKFWEPGLGEGYRVGSGSRSRC